ncbi:hypothetical protein TcYC6_0121940 [Trypanosoma cruzi]|nr:hypothetical protein TcYC6_0121940 [Trypanosoma cruzi]
MGISEICFLAFFLFSQVAFAADSSAASTSNTISMSGDVAAGLLLGVGLFGLLAFSVGMLTSIETSDTLAQIRNDAN